MDQVYQPTVIQDQPFPQAPETDNAVTQQSNATNATPASIQDSPFPVPVIAQETISTALNTRSKKIIQEFQFAPSGAIQIGNFEQGVSGDIRISPDGLVARDIAGNTTVAIDGDSGDAIFSGEVRSGSTVTGDVTILDGGYIVMYDTTGLPSIFIGETP